MFIRLAKVWPIDEWTLYKRLDKSDGTFEQLSEMGV